MTENIYKDFLNELKRANTKYFDKNGIPLKNLIIEDTFKLEPVLIKTILNIPKLKEQFLEVVEGIQVFDKIKFQNFINNKEFLPNSYTKFGNKIGLEHKGEYISKSKDVSLIWPYKDCILQGGQKDEYEKRNEIFYNEILAPDQINRLKDPKVFTDIKYYDKNGELKGEAAIEEIEDLKNHNLLIKGNNLLVIYSLIKVYEEKIKLVYIDTPYNTGNDGFNYNDNFSHSTWLTFMKNRLEATRKLMRKDGLVFMSCDDNEQAYYKILCDEIFGRENFIACLPTIMNLKGNNDQFGFAGTHEYTLVFAKDKKSCKINDYLLDENERKDWRQDDIGYFKKGANLKATGINAPRDKRPYLYYPLLIKQDTKEITTITKDEFSRIYDKEKKEFNDDYVEILEEKYKNKGYLFILPITGNEKMSWRWQIEKVQKEPYNIIIEINNQIYIYKKQRPNLSDLPTKKPKSLFYKPEYSSGNGTAQIKHFFGYKAFNNPKPYELIKDLVYIGSDNNDIIIDFTGGSGTTSHAVLNINKELNDDRKFIIIEQMDYIEDITKKRINKVIKYNNEGSFLYFELMKKNQKYIDKIEAAENSQKLYKIWNNIKQDAHLNYHTSIEEFERNFNEFKSLNLIEQKKILCEILDKNDLYINLSEIEDKNNSISELDKKLNKLIYKL